MAQRRRAMLHTGAALATLLAGCSALNGTPETPDVDASRSAPAGWPSFGHKLYLIFDFDDSELMN